MKVSCSSPSCHLNLFNDIKNGTIVSEFILLGLHLKPQWKIFFFYLVLLSYAFTVMGNFIILYLVFSDPRLHFPMYYFLCNLAIMDICFINNVVPSMLKVFTGQAVHISLKTCFAQLFIYFLIGAAEFFLYGVMSFDRYLAICQPLRYPMIMHRNTYIQLIAGVWLGSFLLIIAPSALLMKSKYCNSIIDNFFCDLGPLLKNSCTDTSFIALLSAIGASAMYVSMCVTLFSYAKIVLEIKKLDSGDGRGKTLSTCSAHAIVVTMSYSSSIFLYAKPAHSHGANFSKGVAILTTMAVPLLNPFIYTLRNQIARKSLTDKLSIRICQKQ